MTEKKGNLKTSLLCSASILVGAFASTPGFSQDADTEFDIEEVVVTGSRIPRKDIVANSPVSVISSDEIKLSTAVEVDRLLGFSTTNSGFKWPNYEQPR